MNKQDLIAVLKNETVLTKTEADAVVRLFFYEISRGKTGPVSGGKRHHP